MTTKICYIDRVWYDVNHHDVCGDMGFSFEDSAETRRPIDKLEDARKENIDFINSDEAVEWGDVGDGKTEDFAIYELRTAEVEYDEEDLDSNGNIYSLCSLPIVDDTDELVEVFVCATEEQASGIIDNYYEGTLWLKVNYRTI